MIKRIAHRYQRLLHPKSYFSSYILYELNIVRIEYNMNNFRIKRIFLHNFLLDKILNSTIDLVFSLFFF